MIWNLLQQAAAAYAAPPPPICGPVCPPMAEEPGPASNFENYKITTTLGASKQSLKLS